MENTHADSNYIPVLPPDNSGKKLVAIICAGLLLFGVLYTAITTISKNNKKDANIHSVSSGSTI